MFRVGIILGHLLATSVQLLLSSESCLTVVLIVPLEGHGSPLTSLQNALGVSLPVVSRYFLRCITLEECTKIASSTRPSLFSRLRSTDKSTATGC